MIALDEFVDLPRAGWPRRRAIAVLLLKVTVATVVLLAGFGGLLMVLFALSPTAATS